MCHRSFSVSVRISYVKEVKVINIKIMGGTLKEVFILLICDHKFIPKSTSNYTDDRKKSDKTLFKKIDK